MYELPRQKVLTNQALQFALFSLSQYNTDTMHSTVSTIFFLLLRFFVSNERCYRINLNYTKSVINFSSSLNYTRVHSHPILTYSRTILNHYSLLVVIRSTCTDGFHNHGETGIDCGGPCVPIKNLCNDNIGCKQDQDCRSAACSIHNICVRKSPVT